MSQRVHTAFKSFTKPALAISELDGPWFKDTTSSSALETCFRCFLLLYALLTVVAKYIWDLQWYQFPKTLAHNHFLWQFCILSLSVIIPVDSRAMIKLSVSLIFLNLLKRVCFWSFSIKIEVIWCQVFEFEEIPIFPIILKTIVEHKVSTWWTACSSTPTKPNPRRVWCNDVWWLESFSYHMPQYSWWLVQKCVVLCANFGAGCEILFARKLSMKTNIEGLDYIKSKQKVFANWQS